MTRRLGLSVSILAMAIAATWATTAACVTAPTEGPVHVAADAAPLLALEHTDGAQADLRRVVDEHEATVLIWWASECSCATRYQARMQDLRERYDSDRVAIYAVSSNADERSDTLTHAAERHGLELPLLVDPGGDLARELAVSSTPTAIVLDGAYAVRYRGWIDNEREVGDPKRIAYLERAVNSVLGGAPAPRTSPVFGCPITK